jgi:SPP1 family predicted phage head-tail adaptor
VQAGKLRHRLVFQSLGTTQDTFGEESNTATIVATLWGRVSPLIGDELFTAQQVVPEITHEVTIRYNSIITPKMQFVFSGRTFNVLSIKAIDEIHHEMILKVKEQI